MALFVVVNHSCVFGRYVHSVVEVAVPVFLMLSGYFFYTEDGGEETGRGVRHLKKIGRLTGFSYAFYILWHLAWSFLNHRPLLFDISTLYTCTNAFAPHLWYLHAYLLMLCFVCALNRAGLYLGRLRCRHLLSYALLCWAASHIDGVPEIVRKVFIFCLGFFAVGMCLRRLTFRLPGIAGIILLFLSLAACALNARFDIDAADYPIFTIVASALALETALSFRVDSACVLARMGKNLSLYIYILHWAVLDVLNTCIYAGECRPIVLYSKPLVLAVSSILVAYAFSVTRLSRRLAGRH